MTKAELEAAHAEYMSAMEAAIHEIASGRHARGVKLALRALGFVEPALKYSRKYPGNQLPELLCTDVVFTWAPVLFDLESLERVSTFLSDRRGFEKLLGAPVASRLESALAEMRAAHRMWDRLEKEGTWNESDLLVSLGGEYKKWKQLADGWEHLGLVERRRERDHHAIRLATNLDDQALAKCSRCGAKEEAVKRESLALRPCRACARSAMFVMVHSTGSTKAGT